MKGFLLREMAIAWQRAGDFLMDQTVIILACFVVVLAIGSEVRILQKVGFGIVMALFYIVTILQAPRAMDIDQREGFIEDLVVYDAPLYFYLMAKILVFWLFFAAPIAITFPVLTAFFHVSEIVTGELFLRLLAFTLHMSVVVVFMSSLMLAIRKNQLLSLALALPLYVPFLIGVTAQDPLIAWTLMGVSICLALPVAIIGGQKLILAHVKDV
jgi:heme exporter protein B